MICPASRKPTYRTAIVCLQKIVWCFPGQPEEQDSVPPDPEAPQGTRSSIPAAVFHLRGPGSQ